jgi:N utilization substance protein A
MKKKPNFGTRTYDTVSTQPKGVGPGSAGQSGDTQGLSDEAEAGSESVEELIEEGQAFEAQVIAGVENAPDADEGEVRPKQVPEDDVPPEYLEQD